MSLFRVVITNQVFESLSSVSCAPANRRKCNVGAGLNRQLLRRMCQLQAVRHIADSYINTKAVVPGV